MSTQVRVAGTWLATIGAVGSLKWSTIADGGFEEVSWRMPLPDTFTHPALRTGSLVELFVGTALIGSGKLAEPNLSDSGWEFTAIGLSDEFYSAHLCLDSGGDSTSIPDVAVDQAIADGFPGTRPTSLSAVAFSETDQTDFLNNVGDLLDAWSDEAGVRWRVNASRTVTAEADPTVPTLYMTAGSARIGLADDDYASDLYLRYRDSTSTFATAHVSDPAATAQLRKAHPVDLTSLGVIDGAKATSIGEGMLAKGKARYAWTDAVRPNRLQLTTPGGQPVDLRLVTAGVMARAFGVISEQGQTLSHFDWIVGRTEYEEGSNVIQLTPVELAARSLGDILSIAVA